MDWGIFGARYFWCSVFLVPGIFGAGFFGAGFFAAGYHYSLLYSVERARALSTIVFHCSRFPMSPGSSLLSAPVSAARMYH